MLDRIVLHIGTHKTGTTAIQRSLVEARPLLLERGALYPSPRGMGPGHGLLVYEVRQAAAQQRRFPAYGRLRQELRDSGASTLVLSAEAFSRLGRGTALLEWAGSLAEELLAGEVMVLGYVRPQWEYIESLYAQEVRQGRRWDPFDDFVASCLQDGDDFDYTKVFAPWRDRFGKRLEVRPYMPPVELGRDVVTDFWEAAGLGSPPPRPPRRTNARTGARTTEMLRALRSMLADRGLDRDLPARKLLAPARRLIEAELPDDRPFSGLTPELVLRIAERFEESNRALLRDYLGERHAGLFSPSTGARERSAWSLDDATERERQVFARAMEEVLAQAPR